MPSHIFVRLGLWQESIESNQAAAVAAAEATQQHMGEAHYQFHAMDFLNYSYLQMGEEAKARQVIEDLKKVPGRTDEVTTNVRVNFTTRTLLELHRWNEALVLAPEGDALDQQMVYQLRTIAAARTGDAKAAEWNLKGLKKALQQDRRRDRRLEDYRRKVAEAWVEYVKGKHDKALKQTPCRCRHAGQRRPWLVRRFSPGDAGGHAAGALTSPRRPLLSMNPY